MNQPVSQLVSESTEGRYLKLPFQLMLKKSHTKHVRQITRNIIGVKKNI